MSFAVGNKLDVHDAPTHRFILLKVKGSFGRRAALSRVQNLRLNASNVTKPLVDLLCYH